MVNNWEAANQVEKGTIGVLKEHGPRDIATERLDGLQVTLDTTEELSVVREVENFKNAFWHTWYSCFNSSEIICDIHWKKCDLPKDSESRRIIDNLNDIEFRESVGLSKISELKWVKITELQLALAFILLEKWEIISSSEDQSINYKDIYNPVSPLLGL